MALAHVDINAGEPNPSARVHESGLERRLVFDEGGAFESPLAGGWRRTVGLTVQDAHSALAIVSRGEMAALVPLRLARSFAGPYALKLFDPPYPSPTLVLEALWRRDLSESQPLVWLRSQLRAAAAEL